MASDTLTTIALAAASLLPPGPTTAYEVRSLPTHTAQAGVPVRLIGIITFVSPTHRTIQLQDATGGVCVHWPDANVNLRPGDEIEVYGVTRAGAFLPEVQTSHVTVLRRRTLPKAIPFNLTVPDSGYLDGEYVVVEAVVQRVWEHGGWLKLDLSRGHADAVAVIPMNLGGDLRQAKELSGAVVKVQGVCRAFPNEQRRPSGNPRLFVTSLSDFTILQPAPHDPFDRPAAMIADLARYRPDPLAARLPVRITGVLTLNQSGRQAYIQDDAGDVVYVNWANVVEVRPGQRVEVVGFPRLNTEPTARLDNAQMRVLANSTLPTAVPGSTAAALAGRLEGRLARFTGTVFAVKHQSHWLTLTVFADGGTFTAVLLNPHDRAEPGSTVEIVGVVTKQPFEMFRPYTFAVVVPTGGLKILTEPPCQPEPPLLDWWTPTRVAYLTAAFFSLLAISTTGLIVLRTRMRRATNQKEQLEQRLKIAAKLETLGQLAGGVAHDFNNLLTVINGSAELLAKGKSDSAQTAELIDRIRLAAAQATTLTGRLLTFGRQRGVKPQPLDLNTAITECKPLLLSLLGERIRLQIVTRPGMPSVLADSGLITQILLNLAVNSRDAMPNGGTLTLSTTVVSPNRVRLSVSDTGCGIPTEIQSHIFELFFTTKETGKGTGLGLPTVYNIVQSLGGEIRFHSTPGQGTTFEIDLPTASEPPPYATPTVLPSTAPDSPPNTPAHRPSVVLLVEDDDAVRSLTRLILESAGLKVHAVARSEEALSFLESTADHIDLLITDITMPGLTGQQLATQAHAYHPNLPVLFLSGYTAEEVQYQGVSKANTDFLHKPFLPRDLIACVSRMLGQSVQEQPDQAVLPCFNI